jgi:hypothetical protein
MGKRQRSIYHQLRDDLLKFRPEGCNLQRLNISQGLLILGQLSLRALIFGLVNLEFIDHAEKKDCKASDSKNVLPTAQSRFLGLEYESEQSEVQTYDKT